MRNYRLNGQKDGRIINTMVFEAADDEAAIAIARARIGLVDGELWCGRRLVASIPAASRPE
jgi:hypothetical protein